ncbi:MAG TPA: fructose-bisphosphate aldolase [Candidatus Nanoarchaeia archaeon]|nr:fructose-bisphosphate aldolase [Candidatus Nanoarchaeia archaeon]
MMKRKERGDGVYKFDEILTNKKGVFLALDEGLDVGPKDFTLDTVDPSFGMDVAVKGGYNGLILNKGVAEFYVEHYQFKVPLIVRLNGRTSISKTEPYAGQVCSVKKAVDLKAKAALYKVYFGSPHEHVMVKEFSKVQEEAQEYGLPLMLWVCPKGPFIQNEVDADLLAYGARVGLELGAHGVCLSYNRDFLGFKWVVKAAAASKVFVMTNERATPEAVVREAHDATRAGAAGIIVKRNVWQCEKPLAITNALKAVIFGGKKLDEALGLLK